MRKPDEKVIKILFKLYNFFPNKMQNEYIWYCIRKRCGAIIMKTNKPFLANDGVMICRRCNESVTFKDLMKANKHNIKKFLEKKE